MGNIERWAHVIVDSETVEPATLDGDERALYDVLDVLPQGRSIERCCIVPAADYRGAVEALRTYGTHLGSCALYVEDTEDVTAECDCGYRAAVGGQ